MSNNLIRMAKELLWIEEDLPNRFEYREATHPTVDDFELYSFDQTWGSTSLGFSGIGGQAITSARTYVFVPITCDQKCFVYFAGRFAYAVEYSKKFMDDVLHMKMEPVSRVGKYLVKTGGSHGRDNEHLSEVGKNQEAC